MISASQKPALGSNSLALSLAASVLLTTVACGVEHGVTERSGSDTWNQQPTNMVDILWVIDDSHSMAEEQELIVGAFGGFIAQIEDTKTDFHLGVITTSFEYDDPDRGKLIGDPAIITNEYDYINLFTDRVRVGTDGSDREKGLEAAAYALSPALSLGANAGFLREEAILLTVIVSDEDDCSDEMALESEGGDACYSETDSLVPVSEYVLDFRSLKAQTDQVMIGAIIGPPASEGCDDATPGHRYREFTDSLGGTVGDICESDFANVMSEMGLTATGVRRAFQLSEPAKVGTIEVYVDEELVEESQINGWTYNETTMFLTFHGNGIPPRGSTIVANYTIQSGG